tara:strand:+ start:6326 stop:6733 length:408 start_codon:yes stop_codon:yes gene_type:complete
MPLLNTKLYDSGLIEMNEDLMCVFVEAHNRAGGGRDTVYLRQHDRGVPLTMRNDFSDSGYLDYSTQVRDLKILREDFDYLSSLLRRGNLILLPLYPLLEEHIMLEKKSPVVTEYIQERIDTLFTIFPITPIARLH